MKKSEVYGFKNNQFQIYIRQNLNFPNVDWGVSYSIHSEQVFYTVRVDGVLKSVILYYCTFFQNVIIGISQFQ